MSTTTKKKVILIATAICLLAIAAFGTMAYFTSKSEVVNTFTSGNIKIVFDESEATLNPTGQNGNLNKWNLNPNVRVIKNSYEDVMSGDIVRKDPTVWNKGKQDAYVAIMIYMPKESMDYLYTDNNFCHADAFKADLRVVNGETTTALDESKWDFQAIGSDKEYYAYRLIYKGDTLSTSDGILKGNNSIKVFDAYKVPTTVNELEASPDNKMSMYLECYAVQAAGFADRNTALNTAFNDELYIDEVPLPTSN